MSLLDLEKTVIIPDYKFEGVQDNSTMKNIVLINRRPRKKLGRYSKIPLLPTYTRPSGLDNRGLHIEHGKRVEHGFCLSKDELGEVRLSPGGDISIWCTTLGLGKVVNNEVCWEILRWKERAKITGLRSI